MIRVHQHSTNRSAFRTDKLSWDTCFDMRSLYACLDTLSYESGKRKGKKKKKIKVEGMSRETSSVSHPIVLNMSARG